MSSRPLPDTPDTHSHLHHPPTNIISAHAPHNRVPQKSHALRLKSRPAHRNTPNQNKMSMETHLPQPSLPSLFPRGGPAALLTLPFRKKPKKRRKKRRNRGKEQSHGRNMPNQNKMLVETCLPQTTHPSLFPRGGPMPDFFLTKALHPPTNPRS